MKINRWVVVWLAIVIVLVVIFALELTRTIRLTDVITYFYLFVVGLVIISILAVVGAAFLGVIITHRIFSVRSFTPFEEEMLQMRKEVKEIREALDELGKKKGED
ncbi:MAG: hypothetical protein JSV43_06220 [Methanobacteriota archaeon]|nr:MAG: hypothetical protein JSV43_06220 [Euryarchaeota archaeon]